MKKLCLAFFSFTALAVTQSGHQVGQVKSPDEETKIHGRIKSPGCQAGYAKEIAHGCCVVKFFRPGCPSCRAVRATFERIANAPDMNDINFVEVNIDALTQLADKHNIDGIPTFVYMNDGIENKALRHVGTSSGLENKIKNNINTLRAQKSPAKQAMAKKGTMVAHRK